MGCTRDNIIIKTKTKGLALEVTKLFGEILKEDLFYDDFILEEDEIEEEDGEFVLMIDEEPLFAMWDAGSQIDYFVKEFIKRFPNDYFFVEDEASFNNCGDTTIYRYEYDEKKQELHLTTAFSDSYSLCMCPECEEDFEEEFVFLEDCLDEGYNEEETFVCPYCGEKFKYDVTIVREVFKLEDFDKEEEI